MFVDIDRVIFIEHRLTSQRHTSEHLDPVRLDLWQDFACRSPDESARAQSGHPLKRRIHRQKTVIDRHTQLIADDLVQRKSVEHFPK